MTPSTPNFVIINADDLGYGDTGPYGAASGARTPHLDRLAAEGCRLDSFYAAPVCTPSRAALLSGCYASRIGMEPVHFPGMRHGFHPDERLLPEILRDRNYRTHLVGKWHLGDQPGAMPNDRGFETYFGIPYSNDMWENNTRWSTQRPHPPLALLRDGKAIERIATPDHQRDLTRRFTDESTRIIRSAGNQPFFLYLAHMAVHRPIFPGKAFAGGSPHGEYVDWVEEVDWSVGQIVDALRETGRAENTVLLFTSDNGSIQHELGANLPLRGHKGQTLEGGIRVPAIFWAPGKIPANTHSPAISGMIDILPTLLPLAGARVPDDRAIDGRSLWPLLTGESAAPVHEYFHYFHRGRLKAIRSGPWKLHLESGELFHLEDDIGESRDVAAGHPAEVERLRAAAERFERELKAQARPAGIFGDGRTIMDDQGKVRPDCVGTQRVFPHPTKH